MAKRLNDKKNIYSLTLRKVECPKCSCNLSITEQRGRINYCPYCHASLKGVSYTQADYAVPDKWVPFSSTFGEVKEDLYKQVCAYKYS